LNDIPGCVKPLFCHLNGNIENANLFFCLLFGLLHFQNSDYTIGLMRLQMQTPILHAGIVVLEVQECRSIC